MILKEQQQLRKIRKGDITSFERLFHNYYKGLFGYAAGLIRNSELAEEIVQDVFYNIWKNRESLRITHNWQSYLYRAVYNNSMMALRRIRRDQELQEGMKAGYEPFTGDALQEMELRELSDLVSQVIGELPERTREIFLLNRQEGLKYREIAGQLSISVKTVEAHMGKALRTLRSCLEKYGHESMR
jgi:RNA polymerase sigma-70 factor (ECF subfamily)